MSGFAHVEFANTEEALRAARHGAPYGFRYMGRLLDVDFAPWVFYFGPAYRVVHISGWPASHTRPALLQWAYDIPNIVNAMIRASPTPSLPPARALTEKNSATISQGTAFRPAWCIPASPVHRRCTYRAPQTGWAHGPRGRAATTCPVALASGAPESAVAVGIHGGGAEEARGGGQGGGLL